MIDLTALAAEIRTDPLTLGYAPLIQSGADGEIAAILNRRPESFSPPKAWTAARPLVPISVVLQWGATGPLASIQAAQSSAIPGIASIAIASMLGFASLETFDVSDLKNRASLTGFVQASVLTQAQVDALIALGTAPASRVEALFELGSTVSSLDVARALRPQG
jgi:hypothetical protein